MYPYKEKENKNSSSAYGIFFGILRGKQKEIYLEMKCLCQRFEFII
jgi:hypothetical protein